MQQQIQRALPQDLESEIGICDTHVSPLFLFSRSTPGSLDLSRLGKGGVGGVGAEGGGAPPGISPPLKDDIEEEEVLEEDDGVEKFEEGSEKADGNPDNDQVGNPEPDVEPAQDLSKSAEVSRSDSPVVEEEEEAKGE